MLHRNVESWKIVLNSGSQRENFLEEVAFIPSLKDEQDFGRLRMGKKCIQAKTQAKLEAQKCDHFVILCIWSMGLGLNVDGVDLGM